MLKQTIIALLLLATFIIAQHPAQFGPALRARINNSTTSPGVELDVHMIYTPEFIWPMGTWNGQMIAETKVWIDFDTEINPYTAWELVSGLNIEIVHPTIHIDAGLFDEHTYPVPPAVSANFPIRNGVTFEYLPAEMPGAVKWIMTANGVWQTPPIKVATIPWLSLQPQFFQVHILTRVIESSFHGTNLNQSQWYYQSMTVEH